MAGSFMRGVSYIDNPRLRRNVGNKLKPKSKSSGDSENDNKKKPQKRLNDYSNSGSPSYDTSVNQSTARSQPEPSTLKTGETQQLQSPTRSRGGQASAESPKAPSKTRAKKEIKT
jgi:hypothetical protein